MSQSFTSDSVTCALAWKVSCVKQYCAFNFGCLFLFDCTQITSIELWMPPVGVSYVGRSQTSNPGRWKIPNVETSTGIEHNCSLCSMDA